MKTLHSIQLQSVWSGRLAVHVLGRTGVGGGLGALLAALLVPWISAATLGTDFTYQGRLTAGGVPAIGSYDLRLKLFDQETNGNQVGLTLTNNNVVVANGLFTTTLDFGPGIFGGTPYWLEVAVRPNIAAAPFGPALFPRQRIFGAPYAMHAVSANSVPWVGIVGKPAGLDDGDDNTTYSAGAGLALSGTAFSIAAGGVGTGQLGNGAVTTIKLADGSVTTAKLADGVALTELLDDDGAGSGLDADLLDGLDSSAFAAANHNHNAADIGGGVFSTDRFSAYTDLGAEGYLDGTDQGDLLTRLQGDGRYWKLGGNPVTTPGADFVGTTDDRALEFRVDSKRALWLKPHLRGPNVIGGASDNQVDVGIAGASIGGGTNNTVRADYAVIGGGSGHLISSSAANSVITGGLQARTSSFGQMAFASGSFASAGDAQTSVYVLRGTNGPGALISNLYLDGSGAVMRLPVGGVWTFDVLVTGLALNGQAGGFRAHGVIKHIGPTTSLVGGSQPLTATAIAQDNGAWNVEVDADDTLDALVIRVTGAPTQVIRWVATVRTAELIF